MKRTLFALLTGTATTFALFVFMAYLIQQDQPIGPEVIAPPIVEVYQSPEDSKVNVKVAPILTPPPPIKMPPRVLAETEPSSSLTSIVIPSVELPAATIDTVIGAQAPDADARPVIRIDPKYPMKAARNGIEGWVRLSFSIDKLGQVFNIKILDSKPKKIFDKAAKRALKKWKYQAKTVAGETVVQNQLSVQLDFNMNNKS